MNQEDMMESDMLVAVDCDDLLIPGAKLSKRAGHTFNTDSPRGCLHRAFSLFLFNADGKLLLTKRAASKITFPSVWTNTCCSHPLYGMHPDEVDVVADAYPHFPGIKHAAIRKVKHELGIDPSCMDHNSIQFISRFKYWAADTITYGDGSPWGEHEVDYILFLQINHDSTLTVHANADEVAEYKYVSIKELQDMLKEPDLLWSPWFLGILDRGGWDWWADIKGSLAGKYTDDSIHFFEPPVEHTASYNLDSHNRQTGVLPCLSREDDTY
jgi:isopentenyl-diphosphate delta-isomerase type 1